MKPLQLSLFEPPPAQVAFKPGDIVVQTWEWIGQYQHSIPFWQVTGITLERKDFSVFCCAVPYGIFPHQVHWFSPKDIKATGFNWMVPTREQIDSWHEPLIGTGGKWPNNISSRVVEGFNLKHPFKLKPYDQEAELVRYLDTLGVDYRNVLRSEYKEKVKHLLA